MLANGATRLAYQVSIGNKKASDLDIIHTKDGTAIDELNGSWHRTTLGFIYSDSRSLAHPLSMDNNQVNGDAKSEQFGDLYMNWILDGTGDSNHGFTNDIYGYGDARRNYMTNQQIPWVLQIGTYARKKP